MKYDQEYIYTLLLRKQLGELTEVEDKLLQKVMSTDEKVRKCWQEQEEAILYTDSAFLDDLRVDLDWYKVKSVLDPAPVRAFRFIKRYRAAAAILLASAAFAGGYYLRPMPQPAAKTAFNTPVSHITLPQLPVRNRFLMPAPVAVATDSFITVVPLPADTLLASLPPTVKITHDTAYQSASLEWNTLTVPPQTDYHIELADGTEVHLNASSTLRFPFIFTGRTREVYLEGEAYFTVAHNPARPFIVHTGTTSVIALGTAFNVNTYDNNSITTSLVQGSVVTDVGDSLDVTLKPGFEAIYCPGERFKVKRFAETLTLGWRDGVYRFHTRPLEELSPVLLRWFGLKLVFATPELSRQLFSGSLEKDKAVEASLEEICKKLRLDFQIYDNTVHFSARK